MSCHKVVFGEYVPIPDFFPSESSSEENLRNTFQQYRISSSNRTKAVRTPNLNHTFNIQSENDTSGSLLYVTASEITPQELSSSNEEANLEKNVDKTKVVAKLAGSVVQNTTTFTTADIRLPQLNLDTVDKPYLDKEINLATRNPLDAVSLYPTLFKKHDAYVVKEIINYRFRNTYDQLIDKLRKKLLDLEARLRIDTYNPKTKRSKGSKEDSNLTEKLARNNGVNPHLLALKLQALQDDYEKEVNQGSYDASISSGNEEDNEKVRENVEGQEFRRTMDNVGKDNIQTVNGNMEIMETQNHGNIRNTDEQAENTIRKAERDSNQTKVNFTSKRNKSRFLRTGVGTKVSRNKQQTTSIDTVEANYLLSLAYLQNLEKTLFPTPVHYTPSPDSTMENNRLSYPSYAEVSGFAFNLDTYEGQKYINKHIDINEEIVNQLIDMLVYGCQNLPQFVGSYMHLDGEKILLLAKTRRDAYMRHLYWAIEPAEETSATIVLEKFSCQINFPKYEKFSRHFKRYYMCILQHKTTVYSTNIKVPNECDYLNFGERFIFENVSNTFQIKISLYSLTVKLSKSKCRKTCLAKRRLHIPMMELIGVARIGLLNANRQKFTFQNPNNDNNPEHKLYTRVTATLNWPKPVRGFLTMGFSQSDRQPRWRRIWSVLEEGQLKYFNFPSDEVFCPPIATVDIRECASIEENSPLKYMMRKTLMLLFHINLNKVLKMYICADRNDEQMMWLEKFKVIIKMKNDWLLFNK